MKIWLNAKKKSLRQRFSVEALEREWKRGIDLETETLSNKVRSDCGRVEIGFVL